MAETTSLYIASEVQGECRAELARALLSRSLHSQFHIAKLQKKSETTKRLDKYFPKNLELSEFLHIFAADKRNDVMTAAQLNAEILRNLGALAEDESMLKRVAKYLRKLVSEKEADPTLLSKEEFFARVDKAEKEIAEGKGIAFTNRDEMNAWLNSL